jgi:hypothetical protein
MEFCSVRIVKNPTKEHKCYLCNLPILGEHKYISGRGDDFFSYRTHNDCFEKATEMCNDCSNRNDCQCDIGACFYEEYLQGRKQ